ncbi:hypothetical protein [Pandoraea aquatica]|nr:hypothetical protein [Pandoraea aquatica]
MESGSERATTRTGVSEGTIVITDTANQTQDLANLNRDTEDLNGTVTRTPDLQSLLSDQSRLMQAATAAGEAVARDIGTYANKKKDEAEKLAKETNDPALKAQYLEEAKQWSEGGDYRATMHAAGGALVAGLGGGNALGGALGAGLTSKLGRVLDGVSDDIRKKRPTGNADMDEALGQIVATGLGTAVGAMAGGSSGAFTGFNTDRFNRQLHPDEKRAIAAKANGDKAALDRLTKAACYNVQCWAEFPEGSDAYNASYVSQAALIGLEPELAWIKSQQAEGRFIYKLGESLLDATKGIGVPIAKNGAKAIAGGAAVAGGFVACTSLVGCAIGGSAAVFGGSEAVEGLTGLYQLTTGKGADGYNPVRELLVTNMPEGWGDTTYDIGALGSNVFGLWVRLPYNIGFTKGIDRKKSIFGVKTTKWNNPLVNPITKKPLPSYVSQGIFTFGVGSKSSKVIDDIRDQKQ